MRGDVLMDACIAEDVARGRGGGVGSRLLADRTECGVIRQRQVR